MGRKADKRMLELIIIVTVKSIGNIKRKLQILGGHKLGSQQKSTPRTCMLQKGSSRKTSDLNKFDNSFNSFLTNEDNINLFQKFLESEFSEENIEFWIACEQFKITQTNKLMPCSQKIYSKFIALQAPKQVNLDSKTREETRISLSNPTRDIFKQAQKSIQFIMENDPYKRFLETDRYKQHILPRKNSSRCTIDLLSKI